MYAYMYTRIYLHSGSKALGWMGFVSIFPTTRNPLSETLYIFGIVVSKLVSIIIAYIYISMCVCILQTYTIWMHAYEDMFPHVYLHIDEYICIYIWIYMYIYMNIYVHIHTEEMIEYTHKCCAGDQWMCHDLYNLISHMTHIYVCVYDSIILFWVCDIYPFGIRKPKRIRFRWYVRCIRCEYQKDIWHMNMWCKFVFTSQNVWDDTWNVWEDTLWYVTNLYEMMQFVTHSVSDMSRTRMIHEMYAMIQGRHIHSSRIVEYENVSLARDTSDDECVTNCIHTDECVTNCIHTHTYSWWHIRQWMCHELIRDQWMCHDLYHLIRVRGISDNECATNCSI